MSRIEQVLYTGKARITGGRDGAARSDDGRLDVPLAHFASAGPGTNPEQLLAAGWGACYLGVMGTLARRSHLALPREAAVDVEIDLGLTASAGYRLQARFRVALPGLDADVAHMMADEAHTMCAYSKALHGNIDIHTSLA